MEQAVVGAVVGASIQVLLQNLLTISQDQINLFWYFKKDLEKLKKSFSMVKDFLDDAETRQVTDNAVKRWLRDLEALAFDADNVFDDINYQLLSNKVETTENKSVIEKVLPFLSISNNPVAYGVTLSLRIKDIIGRLESINQRASEFGLTLSASGSNASGSTETDSFTVDPIFIGRENDVSGIVGMLTTTPSPAAEQVLSVLPIVGMGGLGKTTLARQVFNDVKTKNTHTICVWVHVPRVFDVLVLLKNILTSLTTENAEHGNREAILKKLQTHLGANKYLMVLDDVWNEDQEKWDDFVKSFSGISSATGNCVIVTTRSQKVASIVGTLPVHNLRSLSDGDCWSIIEAKAFRGGDSPSEFETIGINIAKRCKGLPLAAKVFGGLLFGKSKNEWLVIEKTPLSNFGDGDYVYKILKLSFDNLSSPSLKKCFAFCSIFPMGYEIKKETLVELWMAEGFLQTDGRNDIDMETAGSNFVNILVHNSLLQVAKSDRFGNVTHCNMHDLVHDLSYSILHENDKDRGGVCQIRYIGWKPSGDGLLSIPHGQERYVRTLFVDGENFSGINFSDFESLRSLTLMCRDIDELPTSIRDLKHLRYLDISETFIRYLPESIGELYHMQTLRIEKKWGIIGTEKLPDSFSNLISARHLHIPVQKALPPDIRNLTSLQTLPCFHVGGEKGCGISELGNLKDLKGKLAIRNLEKVRGKCEAINANLFRRKNIYNLSFDWGYRREVDEEANNDDESVLEGLQPHPNLKSLSICGFKGKSFPQWTLKMAVQQVDGRCCWEGLDNLMEIKLEKCREVEELPMLGHLPHLKSLYLCHLEKVRSIGPSFYNIKDCSNNINGVVIVFGALERLELLKMPSLVEWAGVDDCPRPHYQLDHVYFPKLKHLKVEGCTQLTSAPSHDFPLLETLDVSGMNSSLPLESICDHESVLEGLQPHPNLRSLSICSFTGKSLPLWTEQLDGRCCWEGLKNLIEITISDCSEVEQLPALGHLPHLKSLFLGSLTKVRSIGSSFYNIKYCSKSRTSSSNNNINGVCEIVVFGALERLELYFMPNLIEWADIDLPCEGDQTQPCEVTVFPRLEYLTVYGCTQLSRAPSYFSRLKELYFSGVESDLALDGLLSNNHNLSSLKINGCRNMTHLDLCLRGGGAPSLEILEIIHCPDLKSIPYPPPSSEGQQQRLTSLRMLSILCCRGLTNLPIEMVESLEVLQLHGLSSITNLGMVIGSVHRMPRLRQLTIIDAPKFSIKQQQLDSNTTGCLSTSNNNLQYLGMSPFRDSSWDNVSYNETVDAMLLLPQFTSLCRLNLFGMEHWECLPDQIQHLTSLQELNLFSFGIQALPKWVENLSSLKTLGLYSCKKLRHLPSKQAMLRLSKLTTLEIHNSPLLIKGKRGNTAYQTSYYVVDSEHTKISHIPFVKVDNDSIVIY